MLIIVALNSFASNHFTSKHLNMMQLVQQNRVKHALMACCLTRFWKW